MSKRNRWMTSCGIFFLWATMAVALHAQTTAVVPPAVTFTTLHEFDQTDGSGPLAGLVQGGNGNLYGTTGVFGANIDGTVFSITPSGTLTTVHNFDGTDGAIASAAMILGANGNLYGTTYSGGASGAGTIFTITPSGTLTILHTFDKTDGSGIMAGLVLGTNGKFYGTASFGGPSNACPNGPGCGTVFVITPGGTLTTLHDFDSTDGAFPEAGVVQGTDGKFYGTTVDGGANPCFGIGCGTVFSITAGGTLTTLYNFCPQPNCNDGFGPDGALVQGADGSFYGTTKGGGVNGDGTVFSITPGGTLTTLHSFDNTDGSTPETGLTLGSDGNFYGATGFGGANGDGTAFSMTPSGALTTLYNFCSIAGCTDGDSPSGLVQDTNGKFYGTTFGGGDYLSAGTVFSLSVGLRAFVATQPASGIVGAAVKILGSNLTGATSVTFNGTAATFTVKSKTEITTTVPAGATTGKVKVVAPGGTFSSNVPFRVSP
jgi:uncharacterized repeat protein (TIGR03803 family)